VPVAELQLTRALLFLGGTAVLWWAAIRCWRGSEGGQPVDRPTWRLGLAACVLTWFVLVIVITEHAA
jgi:hypothetical protein